MTARAARCGNDPRGEFGLPPSVGQLAIPVPGTKNTVLHIGVDPVEHQRRQQAGLGAILNWAVLDLLMDLPAGEPVPVNVIERDLLRRLPAGAAEVTATHITRLAVRPCRVHRAVVAGTATRRNLDRVGRFAPFCARVLLIPKPPRRSDFLSEADFWGIGVTLEHSDGSHEVLVPEQPWVFRRHTMIGWRFVEEAYGQAVARLASDPEATQ